MRRASAILLGLGIVGGAALDLSLGPGRPPVARGRYQVVEADLHAHTFFGDGAMSPLHFVLEARRRGLDAVAVTNHNQVAIARLIRGVSRALGGPTILVGEEITAPGWHLIGIGLENAVDWKQPLPDAIAAVHAQGGAAILAHPTRRFWPAITDGVLVDLDGTEVGHPIASASPRWRRELSEVFERGLRRGRAIAPIASSDDHGLGGLGRYRTHVFARDRSEGAIVEAVRAGRTVVVLNDQAYGDAALIAALPQRAPRPRSVSEVVTGLLGWAGVAGLLFLRRTNGPSAPLHRRADRLPPARQAEIQSRVVRDDVAFFDAIVASIQGDLPVDPRRMYVTGFSNGATMSGRLLMERRLVFAAFAMAAGGPVVPPPADAPAPAVFSVGSKDEGFATVAGVAELPLDETLPSRSAGRWSAPTTSLSSP